MSHVWSDYDSPASWLADGGISGHVGTIRRPRNDFAAALCACFKYRERYPSIGSRRLFAAVNELFTYRVLQAG